MRRLRLLLVAALSYMSVVVAQVNPGINWGWQQAFGSGTGNAFAKRVVYDDNQNLYILGETTDTLIAAGDTVTGTSGIVLKLDSNGNAVWLRGQTINSSEIAIGPDNNIYCSDGSAYIYTPSGNFVGSWGSLTGADIAVDNDTDVIAVGFENDFMCMCTRAWINKTGPLGFYHMFDISYDPMSEYRLSSVDVDDSLNIYVAGNSSGDLTYSGGSFSVNGSVPTVFVMKLDKSGNVIWIKNIVNINNTNSGGLTTVIDLDVNDSLYSVGITGAAAHNMVIGADTLIALDSSGNLKGMLPYIGLFKLDGTARHLFTPVSNGSDFQPTTYCGGTAIHLSNDGAIDIMGYFNDTILIANDSLVEDTTIAYPSFVADDMFLATADTGKAVTKGRYVGNIGSSLGFYSMGDFDISESSVYCIVGTTIDSASRSSVAPNQLYAARENPISIITEVATTNLTDENFIYPNPSSHLVSFRNPVEGRYEVFNINGQLVLSGRVVKGESINVARLSSGVYTLRLTDKASHFRLIISR